MEEKKKGSLKDLWQNEKSHSIIMLSFYLIFIVFLIVSVRTSPSTPKKEEKKEEPKEEIVVPYSELENYEYTLTTDDHILKGKRFHENELITEQEEIYFYEEDTFYHVVTVYKEEVADDFLGISLMDLRPDYLSIFFTKSNLMYEQVYENGKKESTYRVPNIEFDLVEEGFVTIQVVEENNMVQSVTLNIEDHTIQITHDSQNQLKELVLPNLEEKGTL